MIEDEDRPFPPRSEAKVHPDVNQFEMAQVDDAYHAPEAANLETITSHAPSPTIPIVLESQSPPDPQRSPDDNSAASDLVRLLEERKTELAEVNIEILERMASGLRDGLPCQYVQDEDLIGGGYNLIFFFEFADGLQWVARVPSRSRAIRPLEDPLSQQSMQSMIDTVEYINHNTSIPIPEIYGFDVTCDNELGRPYVFMRKVEGEPLADYLFQDCSQHQEQLEKIVRKWGECAIEMATLRFDSIGSLFRATDSNYEVRQLITAPRLNLDPSSCTPNVNCGPYKSAIDYLLALSSLKRFEPGPPTSFGGHLRMSLTESLIGYFVDPRYLNGPFVLSHIDLDLQNIIVDLDNGEITGIIDWDFASVLPFQSHLILSRILNAEFLPASEFEQFGEEYPHVLEFSKRFRQVYEESLVQAAQKFGIDFPVEDIIDRSLMYGLFEKAISQSAYEKYLPALWNHVYGGGMDSLEKVRSEMRSGYWAGWMAKRWKVKVEKKKAKKIKPETIQEVRSPLVGEISIFPPPRRSTAPLVDEIPIARPENPPPVEEIPITQEPRRSEPPIRPTPQPKRRGIFAAAIDQWKEGRDEWFDWVEARHKRVAEIVAERRRRLKRKATLEKLESIQPKKRSQVKSIFFGRA